MATLFDLVNQARWRAPRQSEHENTVLRALTGAGMLLGQNIRAASVAEAAASTVVCLSYINAAKQVLLTNDEQLLRELLRGQLSLMKASAHARARHSLIRGFQAASPTDLKAFGEAVGVATLWDRVIVPHL
jgi:hypothetical protein